MADELTDQQGPSPTAQFNLWKQLGAIKNPDGSFMTQLEPEEELEFLKAAQGKFGGQYKYDVTVGPHSDYDWRGWWKANKEGDPRAKISINPNDHSWHWPDPWKTPYHSSFSNQSIYATPKAGAWNDKDQLVDPTTGQVLLDERARAQQASGQGSPAQGRDPLDEMIYKQLANQGPTQDYHNPFQDQIVELMKKANEPAKEQSWGDAGKQLLAPLAVGLLSSLVYPKYAGRAAGVGQGIQAGTQLWALQNAQRQALAEKQREGLYKQADIFAKLGQTEEMGKMRQEEARTRQQTGLLGLLEKRETHQDMLQMRYDQLAEQAKRDKLASEDRRLSVAERAEAARRHDETMRLLGNAMNAWRYANMGAQNDRHAGDLAEKAATREQKGDQFQQDQLRKRTEFAQNYELKVQTEKDEQDIKQQKAQIDRERMALQHDDKSADRDVKLEALKQREQGLDKRLAETLAQRREAEGHINNYHQGLLGERQEDRYSRERMGDQREAGLNQRSAAGLALKEQDLRRKVEEANRRIQLLQTEEERKMEADKVKAELGEKGIEIRNGRLVIETAKLQERGREFDIGTKQKADQFSEKIDQHVADRDLKVRALNAQTSYHDRLLDARNREDDYREKAAEANTQRAWQQATQIRQKTDELEHEWTMRQSLAQQYFDTGRPEDAKIGAAIAAGAPLGQIMKGPGGTGKIRRIEKFDPETGTVRQFYVPEAEIAANPGKFTSDVGGGMGRLKEQQVENIKVLRPMLEQIRNDLDDPRIARETTVERLYGNIGYTYLHGLGVSEAQAKRITDMKAAFQILTGLASKLSGSRAATLLLQITPHFPDAKDTVALAREKMDRLDLIFDITAHSLGWEGGVKDPERVRQLEDQLHLGEGSGVEAGQRLNAYLQQARPGGRTKGDALTDDDWAALEKQYGGK